MMWCLRPAHQDDVHPRRTSYFADQLTTGTHASSGNAVPHLSELFQRVRRVAQYLRTSPDIANPRELFWSLAPLDGTPASPESFGWYAERARKVAIPNDLSVVVCLDEASALLAVSSDHVGGYLRAVREAATNVGITLVLSDTHSKITNFIPPSASRMASSTSLAGSNGPPLPWITFNVFDLNHQSRLSLSAALNEASDETSDAFQPHCTLQLGRPLWYALVAQGKPLAQVRRTAAMKLLCNNSVELPSTLSVSQALALMSSRVVLHTARSFDQSTAVASHMATCISISNDRREIHARYFSEPILADAAAFVMRQPDRLVQVLEQMATLWSKADTSQGQRGEATFQLLACLIKDTLVMAHATDQRTAEILFTAEVSAREFLYTLTEGCINARLAGTSLLPTQWHIGLSLAAHLSLTRFSFFSSRWLGCAVAGSYSLVHAL